MKMISVLLALTMCMGMLTGCGKDKETPEDATESVTPPDITTDDLEEMLGLDLDLDELAAEAEEEVYEPTAKDRWEGTWFGCMVFGECTGNFAATSGSTYANYLVLNFDDDDSGKFSICNSWNEYGSGEFEIVNDQLQVTSGTVFESPINTDNWKFENIESYGRKIIMEDSITDVNGDVLAYNIWLKPWGADWSEMNQTELYNDIFKPYEDRIKGGQNPPYGFINEYINSDEYVETASTSTDSSDTDKDTKTDSGDNSGSGGSGGLDIPAVDPNNYVLVDNDKVKIVVKGTGVDKYNDSWIGYILELTNKTDHSVYFTARNAILDENSWGGGDTCFFNGQKNKTHFSMVMNPGISDYELTLAIDGVTDVSQLKDVSGYIHVDDDETDELIGDFAYHFK